MARKRNKLCLVKFNANVAVFAAILFAAGCGKDDFEFPCADGAGSVRYEIVSTQGFAAVEKAMPKIREMLLAREPSDFHEIAELYLEIDSIDSVRERYASYRFMLDRLGTICNDRSISRGRRRGVLYSASVDVFTRLHDMKAPVKERVHVWLAYIEKMDAGALWSGEDVRSARVHFVEKFINDMVRLGYLRDSEERNEIESEVAKVIGCRPKP